jgi:hypothetical protein
MRLRFSIRDLLWLTFVAALLTAWWIDRTRLSNEVERLSHPKSPFDMPDPPYIPPSTSLPPPMDSPPPRLKEVTP